MKRLILYDLDGTLVDTRDDITQATNHMLGKMGKAPLSRHEVIPFVGKGLRQLVEGCLKTEDLPRIEEGMKIYRVFYAQHLLDHSILYPAARQVLEHFKERKQVVLTNKPNPYSRNILVGLGVADYFVEIIGGDSEYPKKPDPTALFSIMEKNGVSPSETLFVGDSSIDIDAGRHAGVLTVAMTHGFADHDEIQQASPDFMVDHFEELLQLAKRLGW